MARQPRHPTLVFPSGQRLAEVNMMPHPFLALSWPNLPCTLKAAFRYGKRTLGHPARLPRPRGRSKALGLGPGRRRLRYNAVVVF